ncbi:hypothetical protein FB567DRAFT_21012 [Paraphoma chrysanthemicola]|uniref:RanBP2-type domain-containing protein n=1 Tax=Paraphoma chrysanthemicola TaxID=798071 RepID=A0A8K0W5E7_9PLEO|nr:hypothetical protein FB567DRAFT_21012 [Paraphoma chrysanthemicola]
MITFAWSFSSVDDARRVGNRTLEALAAEKSLEDNINACSFLARCNRMYERLAVYMRDNKYSGHCDAILEQLQHVEQPWTKVAGLVNAYEQCLDDVTTSPKSDKVQRELQLALKDLSKGVNQVRSEVSNSLETIASLMHADTQQVGRFISKAMAKFIRDTRDAVHVKSQSLYLAFEKLRISEHQMRISKTLDAQPNEEKYDDIQKPHALNKRSPDLASTRSTDVAQSIQTFGNSPIYGIDYTIMFEDLLVNEVYPFDLCGFSHTGHCSYCKTHNSVSNRSAICTGCGLANIYYIPTPHWYGADPVEIWCCDECDSSNPFWCTMCPICGAVPPKEPAEIQNRLNCTQALIEARLRPGQIISCEDCGETNIAALKTARLRPGERWSCYDCGEKNIAALGRATCCFACGTYR